MDAKTKAEPVRLTRTQKKVVRRLRNADWGEEPWQVVERIKYALGLTGVGPDSLLPDYIADVIEGREW